MKNFRSQVLVRMALRLNFISVFGRKSEMMLTIASKTPLIKANC